MKATKFLLHITLKLYDVGLVVAASLVMWLFVRVLNCADHHQCYDYVCINYITISLYVIFSKSHLLSLIIVLGFVSHYFYDKM